MLHQRTCLPVLLCAALLANACTEAKLEANSGSTVETDSAGVKIITSEAPAWNETTRWRIDSVPLTVIGANESDTAQQFRFVTSAHRLPNGNVMVGVRSELRLFDSTGAFVRTAARKGNGPGEFQSITSVHRLTGDSILASQHIAEGGMKDVVFAPDGSFASEHFPDMQKFRQLGRWGECHAIILPDRSRTGCQHDPSIPETATNRPSKVIKPGWTSPGPGHLRQLKRQYVISPSFDSAHQINVVAGIEQMGVEYAPGKTAFLGHPLYSHSLTESGGSPLRVFTMLNPHYEIEVWTPQGKLERVIRRTNARRAPTDADLKFAEAELKEHAQMYQQDAVTTAKILAGVTAPDSLPAGFRLIAAPTGELLVMRDGIFPSSTRTLYDVFDRDGKFLGDFGLPTRSFISDIGSNFIVFVHYDENDSPRVEVRRLHRGN
jgi:hypothetical protein